MTRAVKVLLADPEQAVLLADAVRVQFMDAAQYRLHLAAGGTTRAWNSSGRAKRIYVLLAVEKRRGVEPGTLIGVRRKSWIWRGDWLLGTITRDLDTGACLLDGDGLVDMLDEFTDAFASRGLKVEYRTPEVKG